MTPGEVYLAAYDAQVRAFLPEDAGTLLIGESARLAADPDGARQEPADA
jgi:hypothetical protein